MYPDSISNGLVFGGNYVPYFYQSGLFLAYNKPLETDKKTTQSGASTGYDFTSDLVSKPSFSQPPTVEQIIARGYFRIPKGEPETAIISDKKHISWLGLDDIIGQVRRRQEIYQRNIYDLELAKCSAINAVLVLEAERGSVPADGRESYSLNKRLQELYQQQRDERVRLWQDVSRLRQILPETAQQYLTAYRKVSILEDDSKGDGL